MSFRVRPPPREGRALTRDACLRCHDDRYGWDCVACTCPPLADGVGQSSSGSVPPFVNGSYAGGESCSNDRCVTSTRDGPRTRVRWVRVSLPRSHRRRRRRRRVNVTGVPPVSTCAARRCASTSTTAGAARPSPAPLALARPPRAGDPGTAATDIRTHASSGRAGRAIPGPCRQQRERGRHLRPSSVLPVRGDVLRVVLRGIRGLRRQLQGRGQRLRLRLPQIGSYRVGDCADRARRGSRRCVENMHESPPRRLPPCTGR